MTSFSPLDDQNDPAVRAEAEAIWNAYQRALERADRDGICPVCQQPFQRKVQVGRSVYTDPCGHRLYQGFLSREYILAHTTPEELDEQEQTRRTAQWASGWRQLLGLLLWPLRK